VSPPLDKTI